MSPATSLSVILVSYNTSAATVRAVASALDTTSVPIEIIVVDNGSRDGSAGALRDRFPSITVIEAGENLGFARAVNRGAAIASGDHVLLLNPDTVSLPGAIDSLAAFAAAHPGFGMYGGRTVRSNGDLDPSSCWGAPSLWSFFCFATMLSTAFHGSRVFDPESLGPWPRDTVREVPVITGCLLLMRRDAFERLGGMDETYFLYGEDADFSLRARRAGIRPVIVPSAEIVHDSGGSSANPGSKMCMVHAGKATYVRRSWSSPAALLGIGLLQAGALVRACLETASRRRRRMWTEVWRRRRDWRDGYPTAERLLFGRSPSISQEVQ